MSELYKIEKGEPKIGRNTRLATIADAIQAGEMVTVASKSEAALLKWALKRRGKRYRHEVLANCGAVKVYCVGMN